MSHAAYAATQQASETPRDLEIRAVSHITQQLTEANAAGAEPLARIRALNGNARLWAVLMNDLSNPDNDLPEEIKASYLSLGLFVQRASVAAMSGDASLNTLIGINTDVLEALDHQRVSVH